MGRIEETYAGSLEQQLGISVQRAKSLKKLMAKAVVEVFYRHKNVEKRIFEYVESHCDLSKVESFYVGISIGVFLHEYIGYRSNKPNVG